MAAAETQTLFPVLYMCFSFVATIKGCSRCNWKIWTSRLEALQEVCELLGYCTPQVWQDTYRKPWQGLLFLEWTSRRRSRLAARCHYRVTTVVAAVPLSLNDTLAVTALSLSFSLFLTSCTHMWRLHTCRCEQKAAGGELMQGDVSIQGRTIFSRSHRCAGC